MGKEYIVYNLSLKQCSWEKIIRKALGGNFLGGYCQGAIIFGIIFWVQSSRRQLSVGKLSEMAGQFSSVTIVRDAIFLGGSFPWRNNLGGGDYPGCKCPEGTIFLRGNGPNTKSSVTTVKHCSLFKFRFK